MTQFRYTAVDAAGQSLTGLCSGVSIQDVQQQLAARGLSATDIQPELAASRTDPLELAGGLANVTETGQPLAIGLLALAEESTSPRIRRVLQRLSERVAAGESLDTAIESSAHPLPQALPAVIRVGLRSGRLPQALLRYVDLVRESRELNRSLWVGLLHPLLLLVGSLAILILLGVFVIPIFDGILQGFDVELPSLTMSVLWLSRLLNQNWLTLLVTVTTLLLGSYAAIQFLIPAPVHSQLLDLVPILGWMRQNFAMARFSRMLALLIDGATPFPEALRLAGGAANVGIAAAANQLADDVSAGLDPVDAAHQNTAWPRWMVPIFRWHDRGPAFAEALETAADLCVTQSHE
ncbi:MAG: type II secretion system F family protein, partial [Planctomycetaceae bacterium]